MNFLAQALAINETAPFICKRSDAVFRVGLLEDGASRLYRYLTFC